MAARAETQRVLIPRHYRLSLVSRVAEENSFFVLVVTCKPNGFDMTLQDLFILPMKCTVINISRLEMGFCASWVNFLHKVPMYKNIHYADLFII